jgi:hypothetical protein
MAYRNPQASRGATRRAPKARVANPQANRAARARAGVSKHDRSLPRVRKANPQASRGATRAGRKVGWNNG